MASKNKLLGSGKVEEVVAPPLPIDALPDVAYPTWMKHKTKPPIIADSKQAYYDAVAQGYEQTDTV
jgi:hypothetical protein